MFKKVFNILLYVIIFVGLILLIIGLIKIAKVKYEIYESTKEVEEILADIDKDTNSQNNQAVPVSTIISNTTLNSQINDTSSTLNPIGILIFKSDKNNSRVAVYDNLTTQTLKKGAGRATGSAELNSIGNSVLYGHRDSAFKPIWNMKVGDIVEVKSFYSCKQYEVYNIYITTPDDANILSPSDECKLTLVTCYPFVYSGPANQRCVVECKEKIDS